jgi:superfamily II DNA or RNA helicase
VQLRDYQQDCVAAIHRELETSDSTLGVLPTGCGKTVIFGAVARDWSEGRTLVICPTIELVDQAAAKIEQITGEKCDVEQAGRMAGNFFGFEQKYVAASKATLMAKRDGRRRYERFDRVGLVVVDEAHGAATEQYAEMLGYFRERGAKVLGVTATPKRADNKALGQLFKTCAYEMWIPDAIEKGWLVAPHAVCCQIESLDLSAVGTKGTRGDFKDGDLAKVMEQEEVIFEIAEITARESVVDGRTLRTVVYCATVAEAQAVAQRLEDHHNIRAAWVCGDKRLQSQDERQNVLRALASETAALTHVCNVGVLTTGWDCPNLEHIVMARPTRSLGLYTQILGRGTRPLPGVVDFEGSTPESRRAAIAASAKPHFKVTDTCDNTLEHRLCGVADVLGGEMDLVGSGGNKSVAEAVAEQLRLGHTLDVQAAIEKARAAEAKRREEEEEQRRRRQAIESQAKYNRVEVDALGQHGSGAVRGRKHIAYPMPWGKHKGKAISDLSTGYIRALLQNHESKSSDFTIKSHKLKWMLESELSGRRAVQSGKPESVKERFIEQRRAESDARQQPPAPRPPQPPKPPAPRPFAMDPELAEIEALLLA